jgi:hypothetical protein
VPRRDDRKMSLKDVCFDLMDGVAGSDVSIACNEFLVAIEPANNTSPTRATAGKRPAVKIEIRDFRAWRSIYLLHYYCCHSPPQLPSILWNQIVLFPGPPHRRPSAPTIHLILFLFNFLPTSLLNHTNTP